MDDEIPETGTLDKLYLEWSQFTTARTGRELALLNALQTLLAARGCLAPDGTAEIPEAISASFDIGLDDARNVAQALDVPSPEPAQPGAAGEADDEPVSFPVKMLQVDLPPDYDFHQQLFETGEAAADWVRSYLEDLGELDEDFELTVSVKLVDEALYRAWQDAPVV